MLKLICPLLILKSSRNSGFWRGTTYFVQFNTAIILPGDTGRAMSKLRPTFSAKLKGTRTFNSVSSRKSCPTSMPFRERALMSAGSIQFIPPVGSWLVNSNFTRTSSKEKYSATFSLRYPLNYIVSVSLHDCFAALAALGFFDHGPIFPSAALALGWLEVNVFFLRYVTPLIDLSKLLISSSKIHFVFILYFNNGIRKKTHF